ncbi:ABC transporter permease [Corynebacterium pseudodiphtheriticum]|uniref:ABC transporter permease n=1 Tax=Corynebacterium pseudodiphtheriticum TaxID=37637 RepID=UPI00254F75AE|nr:ABC transporter permease [Corynebacterium pseudodiphtheriticum]MDK8685032.1 ABC transporter permease [Corynebacterium pseudodiphtheriticum]
MTAHSFPAGTFSPAPLPASFLRIVWAQTRMETSLILRHGEQLLLNIVVPLAILVGAAFVPFLGEERGLDEIFPMVLAVAAMGSGFTGQAIAVAFDRRYGALKRAGASGVPRTAIIIGKITAIVIVTLIQAIVLAITAGILGFRASFAEIFLTLVVLLLSTASFTAFGLLLGGTLAAEKVLGLGNFLWLVLLGVVGWVLYAQGLGSNGLWTLVPSVAVASGLAEGLRGIIPITELLIIIAWGLAAAGLAIKKFRFS